MAEEAGFDALLAELAAAPSMEVVDPFLGRTIGPYLIDARLGAGGTGRVYRAVDQRLGRSVALKLFPPDGAAADDALREASTLAAVPHPNIAAVYDVGTADDTAYIVLELVEGASLAQLLEAGPLPLAAVWEACRAIARALAHVHLRGIVHGDVKPANVIRSSDGAITLIDFGIARQDSSPPGPLAGTPGFLAPEVQAGAAPDARSDVYAFGVLVEILNHGRSRRLSKLAARCQTEPNDRPKNGTEILRSLTAAGSPQPSRPKDSTQNSSRRRAVMMALVVATAGIVGAAAFTGGTPTPRAKTPPLQFEAVTHERAEAAIMQAALSPSGEVVAYLQHRGIATRSLRDSDGPAPLSVPGDRPPTCVHWKDDSTLVVSTTDGHFELTGDTTRRLPVDGQGCVHPANGGSVFALVGLGAVEIRRPSGNLVHEIPSTALIREVALEPRGRWLALLEGWGDMTARLTIVDLPSGRRRVLHEGSRLLADIGVAGIAVGEDDTLLVALAQRPQDALPTEIVETPIDEWQPRTIGRLDAPVSSLSWSNGRLSLLRWQHDADVHLGALEGSPPSLGPLRRLTASANDERPSAWAPDGSGVWAVRADTRYRLVFVPQSGLPEALPIDASVTWPRPFGPHRLLYWALPSQPQGRARLHVRDLATGQTSTVLERSAETAVGIGVPPPRRFSVRCSARGRCVLADLESSVAFSWIDAEGRVERIGNERVGGRSPDFAIDPGGEMAAVRAASEDALVLVSLANGRETAQLQVPDCVVQYSDFIPNGEGLVVSAMCEGQSPYRLYYVPKDGSEPTELYRSHHGWISHPQVSPNGRTLAVAIKHFGANVLVATAEPARREPEPTGTSRAALPTTTAVPTTAVPTTAVPTNAVPTNAVPTTAMRTTAVPTTTATSADSRTR
ncbi:MAG: serine/threonine-protein kinase [Myxococcota bacterium]